MTTKMPGQQHLGRVEQRLHPGHPDPGPADAPATARGNRARKVSSPPIPRSTRKPGDRVGAERGQLADQAALLGWCDGAAAAAAVPTDSDEHGHADQHDEAERCRAVSRITATMRKDTTAPAARARDVDARPMWKTSVAVSAHHVAGGDPRGQRRRRGGQPCRIRTCSLRNVATSQLATANRWRSTPAAAWIRPSAQQDADHISSGAVSRAATPASIAAQHERGERPARSSR